MKKKQKDKLFDNIPLCAAEFIKLIVKKMRYRKKVRAEVMAELAAHFEDELRDCKTADEKKQKAKQLIEQFGDVKLLAVLLRRAKKRCRPLWRTIIARTFQTAGILVICFILYTAWFLSGKPVVSVDYVAELNRVVRPTADDSLNAAPLYNKAVELYEEKSSDEMSELLGTKYNKATAEQKLLIEEWLNNNEEIFDLVIAGTQKPYYWQEYEGEDMWSVLMPHLSAFRRLAYSLRWRAWLSAERGRYQEAFDDIKHTYRLGQHFKGARTLIEQLVGMAIEALAVRELQSILSEHQINSAELAKLQSDLEGMIADEDFTVSFKTERLFVYDEIQRCFTEGRFGRGHLYLPRIMELELSEGMKVLDTDERKKMNWLASIYVAVTHPEVLFTHPDKQQTKKLFDDYYDFWEQISEKTPGQIKAENIDLEKQETDLFAKNMFLKILTPAFKRIHEISYRLPTDVDATLTIIALLRYKQDMGGYPENLVQLVTAGYMRELPLDSFSDKPLVYRKTEDNFILYSVGENLQDDGGKFGRDKKGRIKLWAYEGDAVFWPMPKSEVK